MFACLIVWLVGFLGGGVAEARGAEEGRGCEGIGRKGLRVGWRNG